MPVAVIVDWYGPYDSLDALKNVVKDEWKGEGRTLYMALAGWNKYQYVGLSENPPGRIHNSHPKLKDKDNKTFYVGHIVTQGITGPRDGKRPDLKLVEKALISFLQPTLNKQNKGNEPEDYVSIFSCFHHPENYESTEPLPKFPTVLAYHYDLQKWIYGKVEYI